MKVTQWFPRSVKPKRPGKYQTTKHWAINIFMDYFDGENWRYNNSKGIIFDDPNIVWRGLAEKPAAQEE